MESFLNNRPSAHSGKTSNVASGAFQSFSNTTGMAGSSGEAKVVEVPWVATPDATCEGKAPPQVSLVMEGDRVVKILVNCSCGQSVALACEY